MPFGPTIVHMSEILLKSDLGEGHARDVLENADVYKTLLESTKAIPWKLDWASMRFVYIGPQIEALLGWPQGSWQSVDDWATRMHPEDRDHVVNFCVSQSQAGVDHEADYRALTKDGGYVWIRDVVHVVRNADGEVDSLIGFMFDISERKRAEEELLRLHKELEQLSLTDGLTGIANRRMFDQRLETEWADARRSGKPLSLLMLDIDYFKQFNDQFGHPLGDRVLQHVGQMLRETLPPRAMAARYGGEEFCVVMRDCHDLQQAMQHAELLRQKIQALRVKVRSTDKVLDTITASFGVALAAPDDNLESLLTRADDALYQAKRGGRNQVQPSPSTPALTG